MPSPARASIRELFVILEPFAPRAERLVDTVRPLSGPGMPPLLGVDAFYRRRTDIALLALRFSAADLSPDAERAVVAIAQRAQLPVLDPARLGDTDRRRFYGEYLRDYKIIAAERQDAAEALGEVALHLGIALSKTAQGSGPSDLAHIRAPTIPDNDDRSWPDAPTADSVEPPLPKQAAHSNIVHIRFLRGDEWVAGRLGQLSLRGARVATDVPPRPGDAVELAIAFRNTAAVVRGEVTEAWPPSVNSIGSPGFYATLPAIQSRAQAQLAELLRRARAAGAKLSPPPPRGAARFPVRWPIQIDTQHGPAMAAALDVSSRGLFVATDEPLAGNLAFALMLGHDAEPVLGRGLVARQVTREMADARGLAQGYGISIIDLAENNGARYAGFVDQVMQRSARRVVAVAAPARARSLQRGLASAGYAASSVPGTSAAFEAVIRESQGADIVVLDASAGGQGERARLQQALARQRLPYITLTGDPPGQARAAVDRALGI